MAKRRADVGTLYKGSPGQWSWLAHRITGLAVTLFFFAHVVDTAVVAAVLYHAINGTKIMVFDFWPSTTRYMKPISAASTVLFLGSMVPITWIMGREILNLALGWDL